MPVGQAGSFAETRIDEDYLPSSLANFRNLRLMPGAVIMRH